jgi:hypothetical protein
VRKEVSASALFDGWHERASASEQYLCRASMRQKANHIPVLALALGGLCTGTQSRLHCCRHRHML